MKRRIAFLLPVFLFFGCAHMAPEIPPYSLSPYFKWNLPQGEGWTMLQRNEQRTTLARSGSHKDESFIVDAVVYQLPDIPSELEFLKFIIKGRQADDDPSRFKNLVEEVVPYKGRKDICVSYHHVSEDHKAGGQKRFENNPLILEDYGYSCRLPENKNLGINFAYSHRYVRGQEEPHAKEHAEAMFQKLEF